MGTLNFSWCGDKIGIASLPGIRDASDRRLLVLGTFNAPQSAPAEVVVALPLPDGQGKAEIDLSKPMVVIVQQDVLEKRMIGRLERYRLNFQGPVPDGVFHLGPIGPKKAGSLHITCQGSGHYGEVRFDNSKGSLEVLFKVSESDSSDFKTPLEFCVRGDVHPGGQPLQFMLNVTGKSDKRLLWQGSASQEGDGIAFRGWVQQKAIQESAKELEALRWPLYSYEEYSWAWVLLALLQTLSEAAKHTASYALKMQIAFPPRVVSLPDGSARSFFGPDIPMALGNPPSSTGNVSPRVDAEEVHFGVSAPKAVKPAGSFIARFTAYVKDAEAEVRERLAKADRKRAKFQPLPESCRWKRGTPVTVRVIGDNFLSTPIEQSFEWNGWAEIRSFQVRAKQDAPADWAQLGFEIAVAGLPVACLWLDIEISAEPRSAEEATRTGRPARSAFVSYAHDDSPEVLGRLSAVTAHDSGLEVFYDWLDLAQGENWKPRLEKEIIQRDMLYLFWSRNAQASKWVNWEWKTALRTKGIHAIRPIPIEPPEIAKPPKELEQINFRDPFLVAREAAKHIAEMKSAEGNIRGVPGRGQKVKSR